MIAKALQFVRNIHVTVWIFIAMALGIVTGVVFPDFSVLYLGLLSSAIFLPMIKACLVPLVFSTLVTGIAGHGDDVGRVGRLATKAMTYFITLTFIALAIGLAVVNIINPGQGINLEGMAKSNITAHNISLKDELNKIFQPSFFQAAVGFNPTTGLPSNSGGEILAIVFMVSPFD